MTVYIVTDSLEIKEETFCVADLAQFNRDMNDSYGEDGWYSDIEDAEIYVKFVGSEYEESKLVSNCNHNYSSYPTSDEGYNEVICTKCGYLYLESTGVF